MKNVKSEKGAITILVLVSVLFMVSFLISAYVIIANKVQTQKEIISETKSIYEDKATMEEVYNSYFSNSNAVPIYTAEQLLMMGNGTKNVNINGKYYDFNNDESTTYVLMNDIKFKASDYTNQLTDGYWTPVGEKISKYEKLVSEDISTEIENQQFKAKFYGKNNNIEVIYTDDENDEYSIVYSQENSYCEIEYAFNIIPKRSDGTTATNTTVYVNDAATDVLGEQIVKTKRLQPLNIKLELLNSQYDTIEITINVINPDKIEYSYNEESKAYDAEIELPIGMPVAFVEQVTGYVKNTIDSKIVSVTNQSINENVLTIDLLPTTIQDAKKSFDIKFQITNDNTLKLEKGTVTYELSGDTSVFNKTPTINRIDKIDVNKSSDITMRLNEIITSNLQSKATCTIKYTFNIGTETVEFYIVINIVLE